MASSAAYILICLCVRVLNGCFLVGEVMLCCSAKAYPLHALLEDCRSFFEQTGRRVTMEYTLLAGVNDSPAQVGASIDNCRNAMRTIKHLHNLSGSSSHTAEHQLPCEARQQLSKEYLWQNVVLPGRQPYVTCCCAMKRHIISVGLDFCIAQNSPASDMLPLCTG